MSNFHKWFDAVSAEAVASPLGKKLTALGFTISHTGGGCLAWEKKIDGAGGWYVWICDEGNGLGTDEDMATYSEFLVGIHHDDLESYEGDCGTLEHCLAWGETALERKRVLKELADCDGAVLYWQVADPAYKRALEAGVIRQVDELLVHPDAIELEAGQCYIMPEKSNG